MACKRKSTSRPGAPAGWGPRISRRILAAWLPWWPTERLARHRPETRTRPFITVAERNARLIIDAANPRAARAGLTPGMPLADGRAIVPGVIVRPADPIGDALALERLARWADRFTPRVMPDGVDTLHLDIAGCARLFGGERALMAALRRALEGFGLTARLALADTPGAAWALARYGVEDSAVVPSGAGRDGLMDALADLPVAALRLGSDVAEALVSFGLDRIRALAAIESVELVRRFGTEPVTRLRQALGLVDEPIVPLRAPPPREARRAFAEPISTAADIHAAVDGLLSDLCLLLSRSGEGARRLRLLCHRVDGNHRTLAIGTSRPLRRPKPLMGLFAERLEQIEPGFGIDEIVLVADVVETVDEAQADWTGENGRGHRPADEEELADLLDRLGNRFGFGRIGRPLPHQSWLPERAALPERVGGAGRGSPNGNDDRLAESSNAPPPIAATWPADRRRPLRLLSPSEPVEVVGAEREREWDGSPAGFRWRGHLHRIRAVEGPERLECEWWHEDAPRRDYYLVEDEMGCRYWLFCEEGGRWFLHGVFG